MRVAYQRDPAQGHPPLQKQDGIVWALGDDQTTDDDNGTGVLGPDPETTARPNA